MSPAEGTLSIACREGSGSTRDRELASLVDGLALVLGHAAPDAVRLADGEGVASALGEHGTDGAHGLRRLVPVGPRGAALALGVEEGLGRPGAARALELPVPQVGVRT